MGLFFNLFIVVDGHDPFTYVCMWCRGWNPGLARASEPQPRPPPFFFFFLDKGKIETLNTPQATPHLPWEGGQCSSSQPQKHHDRPRGPLSQKDILEHWCGFNLLPLQLQQPTVLTALSASRAKWPQELGGTSIPAHTREHARPRSSLQETLQRR